MWKAYAIGIRAEHDSLLGNFTQPANVFVHRCISRLNYVAHKISCFISKIQLMIVGKRALTEFRIEWNTDFSIITTFATSYVPSNAGCGNNIAEGKRQMRCNRKRRSKKKNSYFGCQCIWRVGVCVVTPLLHYYCTDQIGRFLGNSQPRSSSVKVMDAI